MVLFDTKILLLPLHSHPSVPVKYWVRVPYTCCDVTQTWFKYLRGWAMDSPNSLLIGFYTLLSYSYSQRYTYLTNLEEWHWCLSFLGNDVGQCAYYGVLRENRKEKQFLFLFPQANLFFNPWQRVAQYTFVHLRICVCCLMYRGKGHESWFSTKKTAFIERYSFSSKNLFSLTASGTRIIPFLYLRWEDSTI